MILAPSVWELPSAAMQSARSAVRVLVVGGLGPFYYEEDLFAERFTTFFRKEEGFAVEVINGLPRNGAVVTSKLGTGKFDVCILLSYGGGNADANLFKYDEWRTKITTWVDAGGVLVINGEREVVKALHKAFGKSWTMEGDYYRRTSHDLNDSCFMFSSSVGGLAQQLPEKYNVKACMLTDVPLEERVYFAGPDSVTHSLVPMMAGLPVEPEQCAVAASRCGSGGLIFIGDVNAEAETMRIVAKLAKFLTQQRATPNA